MIPFQLLPQSGARSPRDHSLSCRKDLRQQPIVEKREAHAGRFNELFGIVWEASAFSVTDYKLRASILGFSYSPSSAGYRKILSNFLRSLAIAQIMLSPAGTMFGALAKTGSV